MAEYQLTVTDQTIIRTEDGSYIPTAVGNRDYDEYLIWLEEGGVPDPYVPPTEVPPVPTPEQEILFNHENRIRAQEGLPALTREDLVHMRWV